MRIQTTDCCRTLCSLGGFLHLLAVTEGSLRWQELERACGTVPWDCACGGSLRLVVTSEGSALQGCVTVPGGDLPGFSAGAARGEPRLKESSFN